MSDTTLIETEELAARPADDRVILDCRFDLADTEAGRRAYGQGHIPGAMYAHLDHDLSGPITATSGRHPLPDPERLAALFGTWGIGPDTPVIAYDQGPGFFAARAWWLLRWMGHRHVAVLNGGFTAWRERGLPVTTETAPSRPAVFTGSPASDATITAEEIVAGLGDPNTVIVDARAEARFRGAEEPLDPVAGHVPGARCLPASGNVDDSGRFLSAEALRRRFASLPEDRRVISMCGSGVTACHNILAMKLADLKEPRLYVGSWSEWVRDPSSRPVATGEEPAP